MKRPITTGNESIHEREHLTFPYDSANMVILGDTRMVGKGIAPFADYSGIILGVVSPQMVSRCDRRSGVLAVAYERLPGVLLPMLQRVQLRASHS